MCAVSSSLAGCPNCWCPTTSERRHAPLALPNPTSTPATKSWPPTTARRCCRAGAETPRQGQGRGRGAARPALVLARLRHQRFFSCGAQWRHAPTPGGAQRPCVQEAPGLAAECLRGAGSPGPQAPAADPYEFAAWKVATVGIDYHVELERHYYSVPTATPASRWTCVSPPPAWRSSRTASASPAIRGVRSRVGIRRSRPPGPRAPGGGGLEWRALTALGGAIGPHTRRPLPPVSGARHPTGLPCRVGHPASGQGPWEERLEAACQRLARSSPSATAASLAPQHGLERQPAPRPRPASRLTTPMCADRSTTTDRTPHAQPSDL